MLTFIEYLMLENQSAGTDIEDLSPEQLQQRSQEMRRMAQMKKSGREDQADREAMKSLQQQSREATDPRQRADLQRRIRELLDKKQKQAQQPKQPTQPVQPNVTEVFKGYTTGQQSTDKKFKVTYYCGNPNKPCVKYAYGPNADTVKQEFEKTLGRVWDIEQVND